MCLNTKKPHLHFHLQNSPIIQDGRGVKIFFQSILVGPEGKAERKEKYSPIRGDIVQQ